MEYNLQKILNHYVVHLKLTQYYKSTILQFKKKKKEFEAKKKNRTLSTR